MTLSLLGNVLVPLNSFARNLTNLEARLMYSERLTRFLLILLVIALAIIVGWYFGGRP